MVAIPDYPINALPNIHSSLAPSSGAESSEFTKIAIAVLALSVPAFATLAAALYLKPALSKKPKDNGQDLAKAQELEREWVTARDAISQIQDPSIQDGAWHNLRQDGAWHNLRQDGAWHKLAKTLMLQCEWAKARDAIIQIQDPRIQDSGWQSLVDALLSNAKWAEVPDAIVKIQDHIARDSAWRDLAKALMLQCEWAKARDAIIQIQDPRIQDSGWQSLVDALLSNAKWADAKLAEVPDAIVKIQDHIMRDSAWRDLAKALMLQCEWAKARDAIVKIQDHIMRDSAWRALASIYESQKKWIDAVDVLSQRISNLELRLRLLRQLRHSIPAEQDLLADRISAEITNIHEALRRPTRTPPYALRP